MKRAQPEAAIQRAIVQFLSVGLGGNATWFAIPNGGSRHKIEAARMKATGTRAGAPDLAILDCGRVLFIEVKSPKGVLSTAQREFHEMLRRAGCVTGIARSLDDAVAFLKHYGVPLKADVA